jgi:syndecan 4
LYIVNTFCILGNEARHFTLKDDTTAARTAATAPAVVPPTYTTIDGLSFVGK